MKKIVILMLIICPHIVWGQSYLETFYQEEEKQKQEKAAEHKAFLTETVNMLLGDTDGEEVIGGFSFVKSNYGYYVLTDCPREKYRKFSHNFFRETNSKPLYGKYSKPRNGEDWFVTLKDGIMVGTYYAEEIGVLCVHITKKCCVTPFRTRIDGEYLDSFYNGSTNYIDTHIRFEAARARAIIGARVRSGRYF